MELLSSDNGVLIYKCGRCPARLQRSQGRYDGRIVADELYCLSCAEDAEPKEVQETKAKEALAEFVRALARRQARIDAGITPDHVKLEQARTAEEIRYVLDGHPQLIQKSVAYRLSRQGYIVWDRSPLTRGWYATEKGDALLQEFQNGTGQR